MANANGRTVAAGPEAGVATSADGTELAWQRTGSGPAVIVVDAALGSSAFSPARGIVPLLAEQFSVVTYDRRGRGASTDTAPYAVAREVEDLTAVTLATSRMPYVYGPSSGALLALQAAAAGVPMARLAVFEPPLRDGEVAEADEALGRAGPADGGEGGIGGDLTAELAALLAEGRNADAVEHFHRSIGVPDEMLAGMRDTPSFAAFTAIAPTLLHDCALGNETGLDVVAQVPVPTLVVDSEGSTGDLTGWAKAIMDALPRGRHCSLPGEWHRVDDADLTATLTAFFRS